MKRPRPDGVRAPAGEDLAGRLDRAAGIAGSFLAGLGRRVVAHMVGLVLAGFAFFAAGPGLGTTAAAGVYVGLICIFPSPDPQRARGLLATGTGLGQTALLLALGLPWESAPAWGGLQTWCQRLLRRKGGMGWEYAVLPFLSLSLGFSLFSLAGKGVSLWPLASVALLLPAGRLLDRVCVRNAERAAAAPAVWGAPGAAVLAAHRETVRRLKGGAGELPESMRSSLDALCAAAGNIVDCMERDEGDFAPGDRFLTRYLPSAQLLVDEYLRLDRQGRGLASVDESLDRCADLLLRLEKAFAAEHAQLLRNDAVNFAADLNLLDKLLKIKGQ